MEIYVDIPTVAARPWTGRETFTFRRDPFGDICPHAGSKNRLPIFKDAPPMEKPFRIFKYPVPANPQALPGWIFGERRFAPLSGVWPFFLSAKGA